MTPDEYIQLKAFARVDGAMLSLFWIGSFACYVGGLSHQPLGLAALCLAVASLFFIAKRLQNFRDYGREGIISFMRAWAYVILSFFYAGLLFALAQYIYFAYLDHGYVFSVIERTMEMPEFNDMMAQYGMGDMAGQMMDEFRRISPIDFALHGLTTNITFGIILGMPIAALLKTSVKIGKQ